MQESTNNIYSYIEIIYRRKWLVIIPVLLCTLLGAIIAQKMTRYYTSTIHILVEQQKIPETYVTPTDVTPFNQRLNTISQQILSRSKLQKIINDFNLYKSDVVDSNIFYNISSFAGIKSKGQSSQSREYLLEKMTNSIDIKIIGTKNHEDGFSISYTGTDPLVTMNVTNALASLFIEENLKVREEYAEGTSDFLATELESARKELEKQEKAVRQFKESHMGSLPQQLEANLRTLDRLQLEQQSVNYELKNAGDRKLVLEAQLSQTVDASSNQSASSLTMELEKLQSDLTSLLSIYKETYPDVVITKKRIREINENLTKLSVNADRQKTDKLRADNLKETLNPVVYNNLNAVNAETTRLRQKEAEIRNQIKLFEKRVEATPENEQKFTDLRRDYDISLKNYQSLLEKKLNARLSENLEKRQKGERFKVLDPANLPERPVKPDKLQITTIGTLTGLGIGAGLIFLMDFMNPAFRKPEDFDGVLSTPVLASIPLFCSDSKKKRTGLSLTKK